MADPLPVTAAGNAAHAADAAPFRFLFDTAQDAILVADDAGVISHANAAAHRLFGYPDGALHGQILAALWPDADAAGAVGRDVRELPARRRDGTDFPAEVSLSRWRADGRSGLTAIVRDGRPHQLALRRLAAGEARLRFALEGAGDGYWDWNLATRTIYYSPLWKNMLGYDEADIGEGFDEWLRLVHPDDRDAALTAVDDHLQGRAPAYVQELRMRCKDGSWKWILASAKVAELAHDGTPLRMVGTYKDISARKDAETERGRLLKRMELANQAGSIGVWEWDLVANEIIWDEGMYRIHELEPDDASGALLYERWKGCILQEDRPGLHSEIVQAIAHKARLDVAYRIVNRRGRVRHVRALAQPIEIVNGVAARMVGVNWDITDSVEAEAALVAANAEIRAMNDEVRNFAYMVSHDLRSPLVCIQGFVGELGRGLAAIESAFATHCHLLPEAERDRLAGVLTEDLRESLEYIKAAAARMDMLIKAVLRLSRIGHMELQNEPIDLDELIRSIVDSVHHEIEQAAGEVIIEPLPTILGDRGALGQIVANLVSNAVKYRRPQQPLVLRIWADSADAMLTLHIADNGRGMEAEDIPRAFEPFHRVGTQDTEGEGMGLPYVQGLVRRCGGHITCDSTPGEGSVFHVRLPLGGIHHDRDVSHS